MIWLEFLMMYNDGSSVWEEETAVVDFGFPMIEEDLQVVWRKRIDFSYDEEDKQGSV